MVKPLNTHVSDPVADLLTRIRNANLAQKDELVVPASKLNEAVLAILKGEGYVADFGREGDAPHEVVRVGLKYGRQRERTITGIKRISKPGRRVYAKRDSLPRVLGGLGIAIISTSKGLMTDKQAQKDRTGGEVLCFVW